MKKEHRFNVRDFTKSAYEAYFGMKLGDQDKQWAPHKVYKIALILFAFGLKVK